MVAILATDQQHVVCCQLDTGNLPDLVACPESDPLWNRSILLCLLSQDPLDLEGLL